MKNIFISFCTFIAFSNMSWAQVSAENGYSRGKCVIWKIVELRKKGISDRVQIKSVGPKVCAELKEGDTLAFAPIQYSTFVTAAFKNGDSIIIDSNLERYLFPKFNYSDNRLTEYYGKK